MTASDNKSTQYDIKSTQYDFIVITDNKEFKYIVGTLRCNIWQKISLVGSSTNSYF